MKNENIKKGLAIGIMIILFGAGIVPIISGYSIKETNINYQSKDEKNELKVFTSRLNIDGSINIRKERISITDYNRYCNKIKKCESLEEGFIVLKEYTLIPQSMEYYEFKNIIEKKILRLNLNPYYLLFTKKSNCPCNNNPSYDCLGFVFGFLNIEFTPPITNRIIPFLFLKANANGGSWTSFAIPIPPVPDPYTHPECDDLVGSLSGSMEVILFFWLGRLDLNPILDLNGGSFTGFALAGGIIP
ncbi:MAG: hypothetical protein ACFFCM_17305 [Promethearchaeota archaeon]